MKTKEGVRIKMLKLDKGADDGVHVKFYQKGFIYTVSKGLAQCFLSTNSAELAPEEKMNPAPQNKSIPGPPNNKQAPSKGSQKPR